MTPPASHVATLISDARARAITPPLLLAAARALATSCPPEILAEGVAADLRFDAGPDGAEEAVRATFGNAPVDIVIQPAAGRRKRLLLADMDSTVIEQECIDELAAFVGLKAQVATITERAMRGEIAFEPALRERVMLLKGLGADIVARIIAERITLTRGVRALVGTMRAAGAHCCLISGGFTLFTGPIAAAIGFDENRANRLGVQAGAFTGEVAEPILGREAKLAALVEIRDRLGLERADVLAVGDGANDLAMLGEAGLGVAFRAKPAVAAASRARIEHGDLSALLFLQGYRTEEFAAEAAP